MGLILLGAAGLMAWFASLQYRPAPRRMMQAVVLGLAGYAAWLFAYRPERAWEIWWIGRTVAGAAVRVVQALVP